MLVNFRFLQVVSSWCLERSVEEKWNSVRDPEMWSDKRSLKLQPDFTWKLWRRLLNWHPRLNDRKWRVVPKVGDLRLSVKLSYEIKLVSSTSIREQLDIRGVTVSRVCGLRNSNSIEIGRWIHCLCPLVGRWLSLEHKKKCLGKTLSHTSNLLADILRLTESERLNCFPLV